MGRGDGSASLPLAGLRVLDLTTSIAGPWCTQILGALGADVLKVEHPTRGDDTRYWGPPFWNGETAAFLTTNASKRSIGIDLSSPAGQEVVLRLCEGSDVFVQNLRPGVVERLGLDFERVRERSPNVVYCSLGAFGSVGPLRHQPGYDPLMQAAGGIVSLTGEEDRPPVRCGVSIVDQGAGLWATIGILAALRIQEDGGGAKLVDTSLYETALNWVPRQLVDYFATGRVPSKMGSALEIMAPYQAFRAADAWLFIAAGNDRLFTSLCEVIGLPELCDDSRFATNADRVANREQLVELIATPLAEVPAAIWVERLQEAGVPVALVEDIAGVAESPQTEALGILQELPHRSIPGLRVVAPPLSFNGTRLEHRAAAPGLGEHSKALLREAGYAPPEIEDLIRDKVVTVPAELECEEPVAQQTRRVQ
jgi:crotonobetainyl-CoA:carnitine CoA-transferase CaiB-like acyl-CoA transferase